MRKEKKESHFIKKPYYPGGNKAMGMFIKTNLKYPREALDQRIEGTVVIRYTININGDVIDTKIISSLGHGCDEEAVRVVKKFKFKVPKEPRKLKIKFHKTSRIHFKLPKKVNQSIQYHLTKSKKSGRETENPETTSNSYFYKIMY